MKKILFIILIIFTTVLSCAKKGRPSGGPKDTEPPVLISAEPKNNSVNFTGQKIELKFNEYVKLKDINKQLIISPPLNIPPQILPQGGASKSIKITILDTLQPNTTYSFNFGNSIIDNNEGNSLSFFKYVFSTGSNIDSLTLRGTIRDAISKTADDFVSVMLYEVDSTFNDSVVYNKKPRYITNTLDNTTNFNFENLKKGKYLLIALKEETDNFLFNQKTDKIAFKSEYISIPNTDNNELILFKEIENYKPLKAKQERKNRIKFRYEGQAVEPIKINLLTEVDLTSKITKEVKNDTLQYWFKPDIALDSLVFTMIHKKEIDTLTVRMRNKVKSDSLSFKPLSSSLNFDESFKILPSIPIVKIDNSKIKIIDKDSIPISFTSSIDDLTSEIYLEFDKGESQKYSIDILPNAFVDFFESTNDTLNYRANTKSFKDYGNLIVSLKNTPDYPLVAQLVSKKGEVKYELYGTGKTNFEFLNIEPAIYNLRFIFDKNKNKIFDTGNYLKKQQPEHVVYHPEDIEIRANWDVVEQFTLK